MSNWFSRSKDLSNDDQIKQIQSSSDHSNDLRLRNTALNIFAFSASLITIISISKAIKAKKSLSIAQQDVKSWRNMAFRLMNREEEKYFRDEPRLWSKRLNSNQPYTRYKYRPIEKRQQTNFERGTENADNTPILQRSRNVHPHEDWDWIPADWPKKVPLNHNQSFPRHTSNDPNKLNKANKAIVLKDPISLNTQSNSRHDPLELHYDRLQENAFVIDDILQEVQADKERYQKSLFCRRTTPQSINECKKERNINYLQRIEAIESQLWAILVRWNDEERSLDTRKKRHH